MKYESRVKLINPNNNEIKIDNRLKKLNARISKVMDMVSQMHANQKHYLKYRGNKVLKTQRAKMIMLRSLEHKLSRIPKLSAQMSKMSNHGKYRVVLLVTPNHARKLRALAEMDLRPILNSRINKDPEHRARLCGKPGRKAYNLVD